jgi:hypothetical protein
MHVFISAVGHDIDSLIKIFANFKGNAGQFPG